MSEPKDDGSETYNPAGETKWELEQERKHEEDARRIELLDTRQRYLKEHERGDALRSQVATLTAELKTMTCMWEGLRFRIDELRGEHRAVAGRLKAALKKARDYDFTCDNTPSCNDSEEPLDRPEWCRGCELQEELEAALSDPKGTSAYAEWKAMQEVVEMARILTDGTVTYPNLSDAGKFYRDLAAMRHSVADLDKVRKEGR